MATTAQPESRTTRAAAPDANDLPSYRTGLSAEDFRRSFLDNLHLALGRVPGTASPHDLYTALAMTVRDRVNDRGVQTVERCTAEDSRLVAYLSAEYLPGPHTANNLLNLGITAAARDALSALGHNLDEIVELEEEPGLGNGGLGRLASWYMESLASLEIPAVGYGIRYEFGIFDQVIKDGWQVEITDKWLRHGNPWETPRPEIAYDVPFGGHCEGKIHEDGRYRVRWLPEETVKGVAYDTPILGYAVPTCSPLRLWKAEAVESFDFACFNHGDYYRAVEDKVFSENITKVLYPNDEIAAGKALRLRQQFFFVTCSLQDMLRMHLSMNRPLAIFADKFAVQLNDTHPSVAVAELMRLLLDVHDLEWDPAWEITTRTLSYTNHTLLPEALEKWPVDLFARILPRHYQIILEINRRFLDTVRHRFPGDEGRVARMSLIDEGTPRSVRMANLAAVGSHTINGVAELHSTLLKSLVMTDFAEMWPEKFTNVTNGVTPRRFLALSNPRLASLITQKIGDTWLRDLSQLRKLEPLAPDASFRNAWREVKLAAKRDLAALIQSRTGIEVDPTSLFDVQAKRLHEYKRQQLNLLHILTLYNRLKSDPRADVPARTFIFGAKAAPGYRMAKLIIKAISATADRINHDASIGGKLKVVFFPDYNVKNAQHVYPAADLSEQISTAGKEASGTGNMKFALNGALTIGTLDGANVEIRNEVGPEHFFLFGLTADQVAETKRGGYQPYAVRDQNSSLAGAIDLLASLAPREDPHLFAPLVDNLLWSDPFLVLADYAAYVDAQDRAAALWKDPDAWCRASILNCARIGKFSSDRSVRDYARRIWKVKT